MTDRTFKIVIDEVASDEETISWSRETLEVIAEDEADARLIVAGHFPDYTIHSIEEIQ